MFQWHSSPPSLVEYSVGVAHVRTNNVYYNVIITHTHTHTSTDSVWSHSGEASSSPIVGSPSSNGRGTTLMGDAVREEGRRGCVYNITSLLLRLYNEATVVPLDEPTGVRKSSETVLVARRPSRG